MIAYSLTPEELMCLLQLMEAEVYTGIIPIQQEIDFDFVLNELIRKKIILKSEEGLVIDPVYATLVKTILDAEVIIEFVFKKSIFVQLKPQPLLFIKRDLRHKTAYQVIPYKLVEEVVEAILLEYEEKLLFEEIANLKIYKIKNHSIEIEEGICTANANNISKIFLEVM